MKSSMLFIGLIVTVLATSNCTVAQPKKSTAAAKPKAVQVALTDEDNPNIDHSITNEYKCELNGALTLYTHQDDDSRAALRWKNKLYGLKRVETTTGADRFENKKAGLVWISIPAKGMLLDSIRGQQLANECKLANQLK